MKPFKDELLKWICERDACNYPLDRGLLREKACKLIKKYGLNGVKCSDRWMNGFLRSYGLQPGLVNNSGPFFGNYRVWIDLVRDALTRYRHEDLFHLDELTMYSDVSPTNVPGPEGDRLIGDRITAVICCNSTGTMKLPLCVCGTYRAKLRLADHIYSYEPDCLVQDCVLREYVLRVNERASGRRRNVLLLLRRNRAELFRNETFSNVSFLFFPESFPASLRPLRRDVVRFIKMAYRRKYTEKLRGYSAEWRIQDVLETLICAWEDVPRELIIHSFQRTGFRTDDCFLQYDYENWSNLGAEVSFKRFVTFDDDLIEELEEMSSRSHGYYLRGTRGRSIKNRSKRSQRSSTENPVETLDQVRSRIYDKNRLTTGANPGWTTVGGETTDEGDQRSRRPDAENTEYGSNIGPLGPPAEDTVPKETEVQSDRNAADKPRSVDGDKALYATNTGIDRQELADRACASAPRTTSPGVADNEIVESSPVIEENTELRSGDCVADECLLEIVRPVARNAAGDDPRSVETSQETENSKETLIEGSTSGTTGVVSYKRKRPRDESSSESDEESVEKKLKDRNWSKQYETDFVFGSSSSLEASNLKPRISRNSPVSPKE